MTLNRAVEREELNRMIERIQTAGTNRQWMAEVETLRLYVRAYGLTADGVRQLASHHLY